MSPATILSPSPRSSIRSRCIWTRRPPAAACRYRAAGVIHTDFEKGFIRAETIAYDDYIANGGEAGARDTGKLRLEGKEYVVADGDVMHFRFNT